MKNFQKNLISIRTDKGWSGYIIKIKIGIVIEIEILLHYPTRDIIIDPDPDLWRPGDTRFTFVKWVVNHRLHDYLSPEDFKLIYPHQSDLAPDPEFSPSGIGIFIGSDNRYG